MRGDGLMACYFIVTLEFVLHSDLQEAVLKSCPVHNFCMGCNVCILCQNAGKNHQYSISGWPYWEYWPS